MEKLILEIVEKGKVCALKSNGEEITDDCEKLLYLAMAKAKKQPTRIQIKRSDGTVKQTIFIPEQLRLEELRKRDELLILLGAFLKEVVQLPPEVYQVFQNHTSIDEVYDHIIFLLEARGWGNNTEEEIEKKFDRGDEIQKRDNIVHLTAQFLEICGLMDSVLLANFYNFPAIVSVDKLISNINWMINEKETEVVIIYVLDTPKEIEDFESGLLPVFVEEEGNLKIISWISPDITPHNMIPVFDVAQNLIGWLDGDNKLGKEG